MTEIRVPAKSDVPAHLAIPEGSGPWPGIVVVHDGLGMSNDLRRQANWLAESGYLAVAPDLFHYGGRARCLIATMRAAMRGRGRAFDDLDATRRWLSEREECNGNVGVIGFCLGGGYALMLAAGHGYSASSVNYGGLPKEEVLTGACPVVASYGARDRTLKDAPDQLEQVLTRADVEHEIKVYPEAGHAFMNDHSDDRVPLVLRFMNWIARGDYHEPSARDARERIIAFFDAHLRS